jgi:hypothetical protein
MYRELEKYTKRCCDYNNEQYILLKYDYMNLKLQIQVGFRVRIRARCYSLPYLKEFRPEIMLHLYLQHDEIDADTSVASGLRVPK